MPLILATDKKKQKDLYVFEVSLVSRDRSRTVRDTARNAVSKNQTKTINHERNSYLWYHIVSKLKISIIYYFNRFI